MDGVKEQAWRKSSTVFNNFLDVQEIYAPLNDRNYLTRSQGEKLRNKLIDNDTKINDLLAWMPTKGGTWFADFVGALNETKNGTGHAQIIEALQKNLYLAAAENDISQQTVDGEVAVIFGSAASVVKEADPIQAQQGPEAPPPQQPPSQQPPSQNNDPMNRKPFVNHENWTIDLLKTEFRNKKVILSSATAATREELSKQLKDHKKAAELKSYEFLIEVVNDIELKTAICQMDGEIYQCKVCDNLTHSESTYFYGKWGRVPVVVVQTGKKVGSQFQYGSWFETKKALYYMPELKHVFGVGVCGAAVDDNSGKPRVPLGYVVVSSHIIGYDHQKKKEEGDENRSFSSDMSEQSFYRFLSDVTNMGNWEEGLHFGRVLSGSWLVADINAQKLVLDSSRNDEIAFEMEGVGIAAACQNARNVHVEDWLVVKGVSDYANRDKSDAWQPAAASNAIHYLSDMINMKFPQVEP